jgi:cobalamin biosynthesis Mg chelatase CobN
MAQYDPQRSHSRPRKADDEGPAPVDALLGPDPQADPSQPVEGAELRAESSPADRPTAKKAVAKKAVAKKSAAKKSAAKKAAPKKAAAGKPVVQPDPGENPPARAASDSPPGDGSSAVAAAPKEESPAVGSPVVERAEIGTEPRPTGRSGRRSPVVTMAAVVAAVLALIWVLRWRRRSSDD